MACARLGLDAQTSRPGLTSIAFAQLDTARLRALSGEQATPLGGPHSLQSERYLRLREPSAFFVTET